MKNEERDYTGMLLFKEFLGERFEGRIITNYKIDLDELKDSLEKSKQNEYVRPELEYFLSNCIDLCLEKELALDPSMWFNTKELVKKLKIFEGRKEITIYEFIKEMKRYSTTNSEFSTFDYTITLSIKSLVKEVESIIEGKITLSELNNSLTLSELNKTNKKSLQSHNLCVSDEAISCDKSSLLSFVKSLGGDEISVADFFTMMRIKGLIKDFNTVTVIKE